MNFLKNKRLLIVSDTGMFKKNGDIYAFGPVVLELLLFLELFEHVTWIGAHQPHKKNNASFMKIPSVGVTPIFIETPKGAGWSYKLKTLFSYKKMKQLIENELQTHDCIHARAPSHPAFITMMLSKKYPNKQFWFKYAGSWVEPASYFYNLQRNTLKKLKSNSVVTINGTWPNQPQHILAFENPCVTQNHRIAGKLLLTNKTNTAPIDYCFVGAFNENKGVEKILDAWKTLNHPKLGTLYLVGEGVLKEAMELKVADLPQSIVFCGSLSKEEVHRVYEKCSFIILPSTTEGFPKVIGEAMNFGCVPIVSNISCIGQYIAHHKNGFLLTKNSSEGVLEAVNESLLLAEEDFKSFVFRNYELAEKFTYRYYKERIEKEVFTSL